MCYLNQINHSSTEGNMLGKDIEWNRNDPLVNENDEFGM